jgi:putative transferase (TIGR04331 family)
VTERLLLVTTALESSWGRGESLLFAGEWCRLYDRENAWSRREHRVLSYHWTDREKLQRDHGYLNDLQESLLVRLTEALNAYHGVQRPLRYWRMVLGVWLPTYVAVLFDRWESLRIAFSRYGDMDTIALPWAQMQSAPRDCDAFINLCAYSAEWNHALFLRIIRFAHSSQCAIRPSAEVSGLQADAAPPAAAARSGRAARAVLRTLVGELDALVGRFFRSYKVVFVNSYFPIPALIKLNLALRQVPRLHSNEFVYPVEDGEVSAPAPRSADRGSALQISPSAGCDFEAFLTSRIVNDLPCAYVENFGALRDRARKIRISAKVICSAGAHWSNELFKLWCAEQMVAGTKFVALTHGGAIPVLIDQTMWFEEKISDKKVTWSIPYLPNHVRLPANKLVGKRLQSTKTMCSVITQETPLYPFRASDGPIGAGVLEIVPLVRNLFEGLRPDIRSCFCVKPYRNLGWNTRQRFSDALGPDRIFTAQSYERCLAQSRMVICTYPETTFAEAMASGLPTLLVYSAHLWETIPQLHALMSTLRSAEIVFDDAVRAADHVNRIWDDADRWWSSPAVAAAREQFFACCLDLDKRWLRTWATFLRGVAA